MPRKTKYPETKIHLYEYSMAYCKTNSWHSVINDNPNETTCKTCKGLYDIQKRQNRPNAIWRKPG